MKEFVAHWNNRYILDYWYRKKNNLRFNSPEHRQTNLLDVYFEFLEEKMYQDSRNYYIDEIKLKKQKEEQGWLREQKVEMEEEILKDLDLSIFDDGDT